MKVERECMPKRRAARTHVRKYVRVRHVCVSVTARVRECDCTCLYCECAGVSAMHE
jgi:wyosine [tRNA(Phe)-imidazoG37] synthetase (radical SAM superfamily)